MMLFFLLMETTTTTIYNERRGLKMKSCSQLDPCLTRSLAPRLSPEKEECL